MQSQANICRPWPPVGMLWQGFDLHIPGIPWKCLPVRMPLGQPHPYTSPRIANFCFTGLRSRPKRSVQVWVTFPLQQCLANPLHLQNDCCRKNRYLRHFLKYEFLWVFGKTSLPLWKLTRTFLSIFSRELSLITTGDHYGRHTSWISVWRNWSKVGEGSHKHRMLGYGWGGFAWKILDLDGCGIQAVPLPAH